MRKLTLLLATSLLLSLSSAFAQDSAVRDRVEAGVFFDYLGISQTSINNFGLGARFGYRVYPDVMLEGEFAYDYGLNFDEAYRNIANGNVAAIEHTSVGVTQGLIGPNLRRSRVGSFRVSRRPAFSFPPVSWRYSAWAASD